ESFRLRLKGPPNLRPTLQKYYDATGISVIQGSVILQICISCQTSLLGKKRANPSKFAIANGLYMGPIPNEQIHRKCNAQSITTDALYICCVLCVDGDMLYFDHTPISSELIQLHQRRYCLATLFLTGLLG
ncbi:hypothetical protein JG688_00001478, partial [Phytophthora aleatoria]